MRTNANVGALIAAMAAGLFTAGLPTTTQAADTDKVQCHGINACKGKSACHTKSHACAGRNNCKGQGWLPSTEKECKAKGGRSQPLHSAPMSPPKK
jgi:hypothetical protein